MYENENQSFDNREQDYHYTNTPEQQAPTRPRKKNTNAARIAKKAGAIALSAVLFGGVASGTFLGVTTRQAIGTMLQQLHPRKVLPLLPRRQALPAAC
jgi:hypothetical protein